MLYRYYCVLAEGFGLISLIFTVVLLREGQSPTSTPGYWIISVNTKDLKEAYQHNTSNSLPIRDVYYVYTASYCEGDYGEGDYGEGNYSRDFVSCSNFGRDCSFTFHSHFSSILTLIEEKELP